MKTRRGNQGNDSKVIVIEDGDHIILQPHQDASRPPKATIDVEELEIARVHGSRIVAMTNTHMFMHGDGENEVTLATKDAEQEILLDGTPFLDRDEVINYLTTPERHRAHPEPITFIRDALRITDDDLHRGMLIGEITANLTPGERFSYLRAIDTLDGEAPTASDTTSKLAEDTRDALTQLSENRRREAEASEPQPSEPGDPDMSPAARIERGRKRLMGVATEIALAAQEGSLTPALDGIERAYIQDPDGDLPPAHQTAVELERMATTLTSALADAAVIMRRNA